jgi:hypothetical protein
VGSKAILLRNTRPAQRKKNHQACPSDTVPENGAKTADFPGVLLTGELLGIPVKLNVDSGGKPNGIPEQR